ncbi:hypothetical protein M427DRAFT_28974 [Gonapodya prolifera JEL478]|uniref:Cap-specific mRNA (nucleoside-2'-O-)-methyltransferase 1 n=1 Tax=Gonapodya prolifera (strain JEL478) TaxID=1344416 RepID=A0A139AS02_GONPJ|nr:hypothetical protein M427DRAFT_28974 [Gonapodya prolifera JEL478]|eukprot:KXS19528.1 hypothetical protein M427DRAFT_28974 [Gonapodya prolifera JEL478]
MDDVYSDDPEYIATLLEVIPPPRLTPPSVWFAEHPEERRGGGGGGGGGRGRGYSRGGPSGPAFDRGRDRPPPPRPAQGDSRYHPYQDSRDTHAQRDLPEPAYRYAQPPPPHQRDAWGRSAGDPGRNGRGGPGGPGGNSNAHYGGAPPHHQADQHHRYGAHHGDAPAVPLGRDAVPQQMPYGTPPPPHLARHTRPPPPVDYSDIPPIPRYSHAPAAPAPAPAGPPPAPLPLPDVPLRKLVWFESDHVYKDGASVGGLERKEDKPGIVDHDRFSSADLVQELFASKTLLTPLPPATYLPARSKANAYELVARAGFANRAAVKLAEIDWVLGGAVSGNQAATAPGGATWSFVDLCGGPGGFSEYILWRRTSLRLPTIGVGTTLRAASNRAPTAATPEDGSGDLDFQPGQFHPLARRAVEEGAWEAVYGADGSGDVMASGAPAWLGRHVRAKKGCRDGVDVVVADGAFLIPQGRENDQERTHRRLVLCEVAAGLACLKKGGLFLLKLFDTLHPTTTSLLFLLSRLFSRIALLKPASSRPANAERYLVAQGLAGVDRDGLVAYLTQCADRLGELERQDREAEPKEVYEVCKGMEEDDAFGDWIQGRNMRFAMEQAAALQTVFAHVEDPRKPSAWDQQAVARAAMVEWGIGAVAPGTV